MTVLGLGTQVLDCARVRRLIDRHAEAFLRQVYTDAETRACHARRHATEQFAAVWAAKEAVFRSLGTTWRRGTAWTDVEVACDGPGGPRVVLHGATAERAAARGVRTVLVTFAHCRQFATAAAIAQGDGPA